jgi:hypothetical protein
MMKMLLLTKLEDENPPEKWCWICIYKDPPVKTESTKQGVYPNLWQDFYYCDGCVEAYNAMHRKSGVSFKDRFPPQRKD